MISSTSATSAGSSAASQSSSTLDKNQLGKDAFLRLLITELRNQDPLKPMEDKDFIAQLAQFSSLEQMQGMNKTLESFINSQPIYQAAGLIGKTITAVDPYPPIDEKTGAPSQEPVTAKVDSVQTQDGEVMLRVKVKQKEQNSTTGKYEEVERTKDIPMSYVLQIS